MQVATRRISVLGSLMILLVSFFTPIFQATTVQAAYMQNIKVVDWVNEWTLPALNNLDWTDTGIYMKKIDGKVAFCVEHGVQIEMEGSDWNPATYTAAQKAKLAEIAYYAYQENPTNKGYGLAQMMIWEELGAILKFTNSPDYQAKKKAVLAKVNAFNTKPSFNGQNITLNVGESITLKDSNGVLADYIAQTANTAGLKITKSGNNLTLTATADSKDSGKVSFARAKAANVGTSLIYSKGNQQKLVEFMLPDAGSFNLNVTVHKFGNVKAKKVDSDTGKALPGAKLKFEYDGTSKEVTTGADGYAQVNDIKAGTSVKVTEVTAPNGYVNAGDLKTATIEPNQTVEVTLGNKVQLGNIELAKIGREFGTNMFNKYYTLNGATYGVYSADGKKAGTITTDSTGKGKILNLPLGKYSLTEEKAPEGYLLNPDKISAELTYAGQTVAVTDTSVKATDDEQRGTATLVKEDNKTGKTPQGAASLDGAVYDLYRTSNNELVKTVTIKDNQASVSGLELDDYYWLEKTAPTGYLKDTEKHPFKLAYAGQDVKTATISTTAKEQVITGGFDLVKIGSYDWHTSQSKAVTGQDDKNVPLKDAEFAVTSDTTKKVVATGKTDAEGYLKFSGLVYDTYTVTETKTPEGYKTIDPFKVTIHTQDELHHYGLEDKVIEEKLKVVKADAESGKTIPLAGAAFKIKSLETGKYVSMPNLNHTGQTDTYVTNDDGYLITSEALAYGEYELQEVVAPNGYVLEKNPVKFKVDGTAKDSVINITFKDKSQKGIISLNKTGATPVGIEKTSTKYGDQYNLKYDYTALAGVKFEITAAEDIKTNDGTVHAKKGDVVATGTTDADGQIKTPALYLGKYTVKELSAPAGFIINDKPMDVELKYAGQDVEVTSTSLKVTNDYQKLNVTVLKNEEAIKNWDKNQPAIEAKAANGQVFGLFSTDGYTNDSVSMPKDALVGTATVKDGKASFTDLQLPEGAYYVKELDAGAKFDLNDKHYDFDFKAADNDSTKSFEISDEKQAILNKLHFNQFSFKKTNETATVIPAKGYGFSYNGNAKGAVFELLDADKKVIQTVTIDKDSISTFKNVPVGTFYLREKSPSNSGLVLSTDLTKLISDKNGITAYDAKGQKLEAPSNSKAASTDTDQPSVAVTEEQKATAEAASSSSQKSATTTNSDDDAQILFELKNRMIRGTAELTKTDVSNGKVLPNTGIEILNSDGKVVIQGRTNDHGVFSFSNLPAGKYSFREFDAPKGYKINDTPVPFEISKDGQVVKAQMKDEAIPTGSMPQTGNKANTLLTIIGIISLAASILGFIIYGVIKRREYEFIDDDDYDDDDE